MPALGQLPPGCCVRAALPRPLRAVRRRRHPGMTRSRRRTHGEVLPARHRGRPNASTGAAGHRAPEHALTDAAARRPQPGQGVHAAAGLFRDAVDRARRGRRELLDRRGRDVRARRRVGQRQDHDRPLHPAADRADVGRGARSRARTCSRFVATRMRAARRDMQIVFQDPYSSLNPRMRVGDIVEEPLVIHASGTQAERRGARRGAVRAGRARSGAARRAIRTSSAAASGSASASRARWR